MEIAITSWSYILVLILTYIGIFIGVLLGFIAKDEIKTKKNYNLLKFFIYLIITFYFLIMFISNTAIIMLILLIIGITLLYAKIEDYYVYPIMGLIFYLSSQNITVFFSESILLFLLGLPIGTLYLREIRKGRLSYKKAFLKANINFIWYVIISLVLLFIKPF